MRWFVGVFWLVLAWAVMGRSEATAQCRTPGYSVYCSISDSCWEDRISCSTVQYCQGAYRGCEYGQTLVCSSSGPYCTRASDSGGGSGMTTYCNNTCRYANDGDCDDGGPGSDYDLCDFGSDCTDCGARYAYDGDSGCSVTRQSPVPGVLALSGLAVLFGRRSRSRARR